MADVSLYGRLTKDPEIRQVGDQSVAKFAIADGDYFRQKKDAEKQSLFFDCEAWGRNAEMVQSYFQKGNRIKVSGQLCPNNWVNKSGETVKAQILRVDRITMVETKGEKTTTGGGGNLFSDEIPF